MAHLLVVSLSMLVAQPAMTTDGDRDGMAGAPAGDPTTRYCMRIEAVTGSRVEQVRCWTRDAWAEQGVDVDKEWAREGVTVLS